MAGIRQFLTDDNFIATYKDYAKVVEEIGAYTLSYF